jgi:hypothetical protein
VADAPAGSELANLAKKLYDSVMANRKQVGNKYFAEIDRDLLFADSRFQRLSKAGSRKVAKLAQKWNPAKCDPIRVSPHEDECRFSIIDGLHRYLASGINGDNRLVCEIVMGLPQDPSERLKAEAFLFATQNDEVDALTPTEKHNANLILGVPEYIAVDKISNKYNIAIRKSGAGMSKPGVLTCYSTALRIARTAGEPVLDDVYHIICESRWNLSPYGFTDKTLKAISDVIRLHPEHRTEIIAETIKFLKPITPQQFIAYGMAAYPERTRTEQFTLYLEDYLCDAIGMDRIYLVNKGIERRRVPMDLSAS